MLSHMCAYISIQKLFERVRFNNATSKHAKATSGVNKTRVDSKNHTVTFVQCCSVACKLVRLSTTLLLRLELYCAADLSRCCAAF
jgi:hypothetical protein